MTKLSPSGRIPRGVAYIRPDFRPRWRSTPTIGIQRRPAISRVTGLIKRAEKRTRRRVRGPSVTPLAIVFMGRPPESRVVGSHDPPEAAHEEELFPLGDDFF